MIFAIIKTIFLHSELALGVSFLTYSYSSYSIQPYVMALELWVVYEVFKAVLEPYEALRRSWRFIFMISVVALALVNVLWFAYEAQTGACVMLGWMQSLRVIQVSLLLILFALSRLMGLSWRSYCFGVALFVSQTEIVSGKEIYRHLSRAISFMRPRKSPCSLSLTRHDDPMSECKATWTALWSVMRLSTYPSPKWLLASIVVSKPSSSLLV